MADDSLDDFGPPQPGLDQLFAALTARPSPAEMAGEARALEMFRASRQAPGPAAPPPGGPEPQILAVAPSASRRLVLSRRLLAAVAAAAVIVLIGGFAAAAYTAALPAPVQRVAYRVLGFIGVPDNGGDQPSGAPRRVVPGSSASASQSSAPSPGGTGTGPARSSAPGRRQSSSPSPSRSASPSPSQSASPSPSQSATPPPVPSLSVALAAPKIGAGGSDEVIGSATSQGAALPGVMLRFQEHQPGLPGWHLAGRARTGSDGQASLTVAGLMVNTFFRVAGPGGARSLPVRVKVIPPVSLTLATGPRDLKARLTVSSPDARPGDILLLQKLLQGVWQTVQTGRLGPGRRKVFVVQVPAHLNRRFRVVLLPTVVHARSVGGPVIVPHHTA